MATFNSPLEALAFEYASFGVLAVVNNVWTWIAVVTAAVSFWRIRVTTTSIDGEPTCIEQPITEAMAVGPVEETVGPVTGTVKEVLRPLVCNDGVTKGKMTTYCDYGVYGVDVNGGKCVDGELTEVNYVECLGDCGEWWERWERVIKMRNGDDGWYRYVDLTVINGNVVRLWDDNGVLNAGKYLN